MIALLGILCLSSCKHGRPGGTTDRDLQREHKDEQCLIEFSYDEDGKIITDKSVCFCRDKEWSIFRVGPTSRFEALPAAYCDGMLGYPKSDRVDAFIEQTRLLILKGVGW
jgi:hypothetical protein